MMFQIITAWNFVCPEKDLERVVGNIKLRGYNSEIFLTGGFLTRITNKEIKPLSVSDIADFLCPSRRDLYFKKGKNRIRMKSRKTWGRLAGRVLENFAFTLFDKFYELENSWSYSKIMETVNTISENFKDENFQSFQDLNRLKSRPDEESDWLLKLLTYDGRAELGLRLLHKVLSKGNNNEMDIKDLEITPGELKPNPKQIGISKPAKPDFLVEKYKVVGDIKSGIGGFKDHYLLTCAGYALAYENEKGKNNDINFGIIYFFPTRYSEHAKPISFGQVYIFPIDDALRDWFLSIRHRAYGIVSEDSPPDFPEDKSYCPFCQFYDICKSQGLRV